MLKSRELALCAEGADRDEHADQEIGDADTEQRLQRISELRLARWSSAPYAPQDNTAPATNITHFMRSSSPFQSL